MKLSQIEENISELIGCIHSADYDADGFIYDLLLAYGHRKQSVSRLRSGERNLAKNQAKNLDKDQQDVIWKRHLYYRHSAGVELLSEIDEMKRDAVVARHKLRFIIVTNFDRFLAIDTKTGDTLDITLAELPKHFDFFLPWAGMEKALYQGENPADVKAAEKMAKLFDLIKEDNADTLNQEDETAVHQFNVFLTRLLFCFFAEDTHIFDSNLFSYCLESHTKADGSDVANYLNRLFAVLDTEETERKDLPDYLIKFPYVNGGLFAETIPSPEFSTKSRKILIECGSELDWSDINPDIFGSMIQAVVHPDQRGNMGMHYTSVINIMKVIEPLFLNDLYEELEHIENDLEPQSKPSRLRKLRKRIKHIKIFDPACGSGNFLIIAFKELRKLEMEIIKSIQEVESQPEQGDLIQAQGISYSEIKLSQFYGIELDDFASEVATLSLWLAEHQMNSEFKDEFGECAPSLPLKKSGNIVCGNATRIDWEDVCPKEDGDEVFILGNPPYLGGKYQSKKQKSDMSYVFKGVKRFGELDYIACWFYKASEYSVTTNSIFAFVSTNSINQGAQVHQLWPLIFDNNLEIYFAYKPFYWSNNAKSKAAVICTIIGIGIKRHKLKLFFDEQRCTTVKNINAYLTASVNIIVNQSLKPISNLPIIITGNSPYDGGFLILTRDEKIEMGEAYPESCQYMRRLYGAHDFLNGKKRWCLWITDENIDAALSIDEIRNRVNKVQAFRKTGGQVAKGLAKYPHRFRYTHTAKSTIIIIPRVSSQRREYIPIGFLDSSNIIADSAQAIYDPDPWVFGIISSKIHMVWVKITAGRLKSDYRYSSALCYNSFPFPSIDKVQKKILENCVFNILNEREQSSEKTLAQLYDPDKMPEDLRQAHHEMDLAVEQCYRKKPFENDEERLEYLFKLYEEMIAKEEAI